MSLSKQAIWTRTLAAGLASANKGNIFWTKSDAMQTYHYFHKANQ